MPDSTKPAAVRAQRGDQIRCRGWRQEALLRMLEYVLEIGERPEDLVVYAARGKAARDWESYSRIVASLRTLGEDETLLVQSGKPVGVFPSSTDAPIVLMACGNVVGHYATPEYFDELCDRGLIMWGGPHSGRLAVHRFPRCFARGLRVVTGRREGAFRRVARRQVRAHGRAWGDGIGPTARNRAGRR